MAMIHEIASSANLTPQSNTTLRQAIELIIAWCDKNPEKKIIKISWLFTLRAKHLAAALRVLLGIIDPE